MITMGQKYWAAGIVAGLFCSFASAKDERRHEVMVVTANKMEEDVHKLPIPIQVLSGEELQDAGIDSIEQLMGKLPNMVVTKNYGAFSSPTFRGLTTSVFNRETPITVFVDGIPHSSSYGLDIGLLNVERVEILRGSQSTVYGHSSIGGVINVITRPPSEELTASARVEGASNGKRKLEGLVSGELIPETLAVTLSARGIKSDGYLNNTYQNRGHYDTLDERQFNIRANWRISERLVMDLLVDRTDKDNGGAAFSAVDGTTFYDTKQEVDTFNKIKSNQQALKLAYSFDTFDLSWHLGHKTTDIEHQSDFDRSNASTCMFPPPMQSFGCVEGAYFFDTSKLKATNTELRINSTQGGGVRWVAGLYTADDKYDAVENGSSFPAMPMFNNNLFTDIKGRQYAIFGQASIPLGSHFEVTPGLRWQRDERKTDFANHAGVSYSQSDHWNKVLPKLALSYQVHHDTLLYTSVSQGYQPGGFNFTAANPDKAKFDPQTSLDYELGVKTSLWDHRLDLGINLFYLDIKDVHGLSISSTSVVDTVNAGSATSKGAELDLNAFLGGAWQLGWNLGYTKASYGSGKYSGNRTQFTPKLSSTASLSYDQGTGLFGRLEQVYKGDMYTDLANTIKVDSYALVNLRAGYRWTNGITLETYADNLFDKEYFTNAYRLPLPGLPQVRQIGEPLTIGVALRYDY